MHQACSSQNSYTAERSPFSILGCLRLHVIWPARKISKPDDQTKLMQQYLNQFVEDSKIPPVESALLGSCCVGKRSILNQIIYNAWLELPDYTDQPWPESDHLIHGRHVAVRWDAVSLDFGQERIQRMIRHGVLKASNSESCMLVYNVTHADGFKQLECTCQFWLESENDSVFAKVKVFVVASRVDREEADWEVTLEQGRNLSRRLDVPFLEVSAPADTGLNNEIITGIIKSTLPTGWSRECDEDCRNAERARHGSRYAAKTKAMLSCVGNCLYPITATEPGSAVNAYSMVSYFGYSSSKASSDHWMLHPSTKPTEDEGSKCFTCRR